MDRKLEALEREFVARHLQFHPGTAALAGLHEHDLSLEDLSRESIEGFCAELDRYRSRASALDGLSPADRIERDVLLAIIDGTLFDYRQVRPWENDPYSYAEVLSSQLNTILIFDYAPLGERLEAVIAKEMQIPRYLETAKRNLKPTAPILVDYGIRGAEGALSLVRKDLPSAFASVSTPDLRRRFEEATRAAVQALESFLAWLKSDYPAGDARAYALGREVYAGWLAARERITTPLEDLERWALDAIETTRDELRRQSARLDPSAAPD